MPKKSATNKVAVVSTSKVSSESFAMWNKGLAAVFAVQGVLILILSAVRMYPIATSFLGIDSLQTQAQDSMVRATGTQHLFDVNLAFVVAAFLFVAAIAHLLMVTKLRDEYERGLGTGVNKIRWISYAVSASIMMVAIGLVVGVQDISTLLMLVGLTALACVLALTTMEYHNAGTVRANWLSYVVGAIPWLVITTYVISGATYGNVPDFAWVVYGTMLVLSGCLGAIMYLQARRSGKWVDHLYGEKMFMIFSLVAKTLLAWELFFGVLHP